MKIVPSRRQQIALDLAIGVGLLAGSVPFTLRSDHLGAGTVLDTILLPAVVLPILLRRRAPMAAAAALAAGCVVSAVPTFEQFRLLSAIPAGMLILYSVATREERPRALIGLALVLAGLTFVGFTEAVGPEDGGGVSLILWAWPLCVAVWLGGHFVRSREVLAAELAERSGLLERRREETAQLAVEVERTLLESDIDAAARASVLEMIELATSGEQALAADGERARDAFARVEQLARETLNAMRGLLGVLRSDERAGSPTTPAPRSPERDDTEISATGVPSTRERRTLYPADLALAGALATVFVIILFAKHGVSDSVWPAIAVVLLAAPIAVRRTHPVAGACWGSALVLVAPPSAWDDATALAAVLAYSAGAYASRRAGLLAVAAITASMQIEADVEDVWGVIVTALVALPPWSVGRLLRSRRGLVRALAEHNRDLEAAERELSRLSVRRERARVAHELHDLVGHQLAIIAVQAQAGVRLVGADGSAAADGFAAIRACGRRALSEMARLVDILSDESSGAPCRTLDVLLEQARAAGLEVRLTPLPSDVSLPAVLEEAAVRVVQEALTNTIKHAPGADVDVRLAVQDGELEVVVSDGGATGSSTLAGTGSGIGLAGMADHVASLGGSLDSGPLESGGWRVLARLPLTPRGVPVVTPQA